MHVCCCNGPREMTAMCTLGTPPGFVDSQYLWDLTNNQTHFSIQPATPENWRVSDEETTWFRGSKATWNSRWSSVSSVLAVNVIFEHNVPVKTREKRINRKSVCAVPGMAKSVQLVWVRQAATAPGNCTTLFDVVCTVHHPTMCIWTNKMHRILVIRLYFPLDALHVSDCITQSSGATL